MKRLVPISIFVLAALLLSISPLAASAQAGPTTIYVVQPGDTAFSIASRHCMTVQELSNLNGAVIANPNLLYPGMQLRVVNRCGGGNDGGWKCGGWGGVYDRGPGWHARGTVWGNTYIVASGDTAFSIAQRFGISTDALARANGINPWRIWAGQRLIIPGLGAGNPCPPTPCIPGPPPNPCVPTPCNPWPSPNPCPTITPSITVKPITPSPTNTPTQTRIQITSPAPNATLPATFTVTGTGQGLFEGSLVVRAINNAGQLLAPDVPTTLQGTNVGAGGAGTFSVQMTVNVAQSTQGFIVAFAQTPYASTSVPVTFAGSGGSGGVVYHDYQGAECRVAVQVGAPFFAAVGGAQVGTFANPGNFTATRGAKQNNQIWFFIGPVQTTPASVWVPQTSIVNATPGCFAWLVNVQP